MDEIQKRIDRERKKQGLTLEDLGKRFTPAKTRQNVWVTLNRDGHLRYDAIKEYSEALGVDLFKAADTEQE